MYVVPRRRDLHDNHSALGTESALKFSHYPFKQFIQFFIKLKHNFHTNIGLNGAFELIRKETSVGALFLVNRSVFAAKQTISH